MSEDIKKVTGFNTIEELRAYDLGRAHEQKVMIEFIRNYEGDTNSALGAILNNKFNKEIPKSCPEINDLQAYIRKLSNNIGYISTEYEVEIDKIIPALEKVRQINSALRGRIQQLEDQLSLNK